MLSPRKHSEATASHSARFGTTHWTVVLNASQGAEEALVRLCRIYWPPLYAYIHRRGHALLELVMIQLRNEFVAARKGDMFETLNHHLTGEPGGESYQELAARLNTSEGAVKVTVHRLRRRFGELVRAQIARTLDRPEEIDD